MRGEFIKKLFSLTFLVLTIGIFLPFLLANEAHAGTEVSVTLRGQLLQEGTYAETPFDKAIDSKEVGLYDLSTNKKLATSKADKSGSKWVYEISEKIETGRTYYVSFGNSSPSKCGGGGVLPICTTTWKGATEFLIPDGATSGARNPVVIMAGHNAGKDGITTSGIDIAVAESLENPLITNTIGQVTGWVTDQMNKLISFLMSAITETLNIGNFIERPELMGVWVQVRNLALSLLTLGILIIAFANILQIDIQRFGLNRMLPRLIIAVVATYFSFIVMKFLLEIVGALQLGLIQAASGAGVSTTASGFKFEASWMDIVAYPGTVFASMPLLTIIFLLVLMIAFFWLLLVLIVRIAVIWLLVCVAPLACMMMVMPFTEQFWKQWWAQWWKWTFMGPAVLFLLYLSTRLLSAGPIAIATGSPSSSIIMMILAIVCIFIAATVPMTMGINQIWKSVQGAVKSVRGGANVLSGGRSEAAIGIRNARIAERRKRQVGSYMTGLAASDNKFANLVAGVKTDAERREAYSSQVNEMAKTIQTEGIDKGRAQNEYDAANGLRRAALARIMGEEGWFDDDPMNAARMQKFAEDYNNDVYVRNSVNSKQPELLSAAKLANAPLGSDGSKAEAKAVAKALTTVADLKTAQIDRLDHQQISELLSNPQKIKSAAEKLDTKRLAMLGRKFDELPNAIKQSISQSLDLEGKQVLTRMRQASQDYQQKHAAARARGNEDEMKRYNTRHDWRRS